MALQWMPPPLQRRTSWRFALEEHTFIHWVCSGILWQNWSFCSEIWKMWATYIVLYWTWWNYGMKPSQFRQWLPTEAHVATFTAMWHLNPTSGDGEPHTPPQQTPPSEETLCCLHAQLGDLNDSQLWQLVKDLSQELAQHKLTVPPATPS